MGDDLRTVAGLLLAAPLAAQETTLHVDVKLVSVFVNVRTTTGRWLAG